VKLSWEPVCEVGQWKMEYFGKADHQDYQGSACRSASTSKQLHASWPHGPALATMQRGWSLRAVGHFRMDQGVYQFVAGSSDASRLWVDGARVVDEWKNPGRTGRSSYQQVSAGVHKIVVELRSAGESPTLHGEWYQEPQCPRGQWRLQYFSDKAFTQHKATQCRRPGHQHPLALDWGVGGPQALDGQEDAFSVRASGEFFFKAGKYFFKQVSDDGSRLSVNGTTLLDNLKSKGAVWMTKAVPLDGWAAVTSEMVEHSQVAKLSVDWTEEPKCSSSDWTLKFFADSHLKAHRATKCVPVTGTIQALSLAWTAGVPELGGRTKGFSVLASTTTSLPEKFRFSAAGVRGVRANAAGTVVLDQWQAKGPVRSKVLEAHGDVPMVVSFHAQGASGRVVFGWEPHCGKGLWAVKLFAKPNFEEHTATRCAPVHSEELALNLQWGTAGVPELNGQTAGFSVRALGHLPLQAETLRFSVLGSGGTRLHVNGTQVLEKWKVPGKKFHTDFMESNGGLAHVKVEMGHTEGPAMLQVGVLPEVKCGEGSWKVQYFTDRHFKHHRASTCQASLGSWEHQHGRLRLDWPAAGPAELGGRSSTFAVRALGVFAFDGGHYTFTDKSNDGSKVLIDGQVVIDRWHSGAQHGKVGVELEGLHTVTAMLLERSGPSFVHVAWAPTPKKVPGSEAPPERRPQQGKATGNKKALAFLAA